MVAELDHKFQQEVFSEHHHWYADEPIQLGGKNSGPDPYEHLLAALGACTAMTIRMYADHKKFLLNTWKCLCHTNATICKMSVMR